MLFSLNCLNYIMNDVFVFKVLENIKQYKKNIPNFRSKYILC